MQREGPTPLGRDTCKGRDGGKGHWKGGLKAESKDSGFGKRSGKFGGRGSRQSSGVGEKGCQGVCWSCGVLGHRSHECMKHRHANDVAEYEVDQDTVVVSPDPMETSRGPEGTHSQRSPSTRTARARPMTRTR